GRAQPVGRTQLGNRDPVPAGDLEERVAALDLVLDDAIRGDLGEVPLDVPRDLQGGEELGVEVARGEPEAGPRVTGDEHAEVVGADGTPRALDAREAVVVRGEGKRPVRQRLAQ